MTPEPSERCDLLARHRRAEELAEERIVEKRIAVLDHAGGVDVDHRRRHALHHRREGELELGGRGRHAALLRGRRSDRQPASRTNERGWRVRPGARADAAWETPNRTRATS